PGSAQRGPRGPRPRSGGGAGTTVTDHSISERPEVERSDDDAGRLCTHAVSKHFGHGPGAVHALDRIDLTVEAGEFVCLVGASGCGKSTLLNLIARLDSPTSGHIDSDGRTALMFQESALFPWLTVRQNVELALKLRGVAKRD